MTKMIILLLLLLLLLLLSININSQSVYSNSNSNNGNIIKIKNNEHYDFIKSYSLLFNSDVTRKYSNSDDVIIEHERLLSAILNNVTLSTTQRPYVLNLMEDCGGICHYKLSRYLTSITSLSPSSLLLSKKTYSPYSFADQNERYKILKIDKALLLTSLDNIHKIIEKYPYYVRGYTPLLSINKIDIDTYDNSRCGRKPNEQNITSSITIVIAPLDNQDMSLFIRKMQQFQIESTVLFEFDHDGIEPNIQSNGLVSFFDCEPIDDILQSLSEFNEILWIEPAPEFELFNRWTRSICQTATVDNTPLYNSAQLTGLDVVIGIADTGIDMNHCHFYDPNHPTPVNTINRQHRKVVTYAYTTSGLTRTDQVDLGFEGHGTHVAGYHRHHYYLNHHYNYHIIIITIIIIFIRTAAGDPLQSYGDFKKYRGVAYNAKIAFFDIGINYNNPALNSIKVPTNIETRLFGVLNTAGAKIQSMSWGGWKDVYDSTTIQVDKYMYDNPDVLIIFAAGNNGTNSNTVGTPANCKNCLTVGAHLNDLKSFESYASSDLIDQITIDSVASFSSKGPTNDDRIKPDILAPGWFVASASASNTVDITTGGGDYHCDVMWMRGTSMAAPAAAGAAALVYEYFTKGFYPSGTKNSADAFVPSGALLKAMLLVSGQAMKNVVTSDATDSVQFSSVLISIWSNGKYPNNLEGYGRIKLDSVLNFGQSSRSPLTLFVVGAASSSSSNYAQVTTSEPSKQYTVRSTSQKKIRVCLTYTDKEPSVTLPSGTSALVNKLTIALYAATDLSYSNPIKNTLIYPDNANNVKMIEFANPSANTDYVIKVTATLLYTPTQPFALVIVQDITPAQSSTEFYSTKFSDEYELNRENIVAISLLTTLAFILLLSLISMYYQKRTYSTEANSRPVSLVALSSIPPTRMIFPQEREQSPTYAINMD